MENQKFQGVSFDISNVKAEIENENHVKQIKKKNVQRAAALPQYQLNSLGGPLSEDFKAQDQV